MKRILGLDLGTTSIGWALIEEADQKFRNHMKEQFESYQVNHNLTSQLSTGSF